MAAPFDDIATGGIAYASNLISIKHNHDVVTTFHPRRSARAISRAVTEFEARVIEMAWSTGYWSNVIADTIDSHLDTTIFVAAAGTIPPALQSLGVKPTTKFPARHRSVVAVSAMAESGGLTEASSYDASSDISAIGDALPDWSRGTKTPTAGDTEADIWMLGESSGASAIVAGVVAQIWSSNPSRSVDSVRTELFCNANCRTEDLVGRVLDYPTTKGQWCIANSMPQQ